MITGIIVTHGSLAGALVQTVEKIVGPVESLISVSNDGLSLNDLTTRLEAIIQNHLQGGSICILVELRGGSCWMAAKRAIRNYQNIFIISGISIPMLLTFVTQRDSLDPAGLVEKMQDSGIKGIVIEKLQEEKSTQ